MLIFIDESGTFQIPSSPGIVSTVAAVVVPHSIGTSLFRETRALLKQWSDGEREVKGSKLHESQVSAFAEMLAKHDVLVIASAIDLSSHTDHDIDHHKAMQASFIEKSANEHPHPNVTKGLLDLAQRLRDLPNQLYAQASVLTRTIEDVLHLAPLYYVQRLPVELGRFVWRLDAKADELTRYEKLWLDLVLPMLQTGSLREPFPQLKGADYGAFSRFYVDQESEDTEWLTKHAKEPVQGLTDIKLIMTEDLAFRDSQSYQGLQIADIMATTIRRALNRRLQKTGWASIGHLMPQRANNASPASLLTLKAEDENSIPYADVLRAMAKGKKPMLTAELIESHDRSRARNSRKRARRVRKHK